MNRAEAIHALSATLIGSMAREHPDRRQAPTEAAEYDVRRFGAAADGRADDASAIQRAVSAASAGGGGTVWLPRGRYRLGSSVVVPANTDRVVSIRGDGLRNTIVYASASGQPAVRFGADAAEPAGQFERQTLYAGLEELSINGTLVTNGPATGVEFVEMQRGWMRNVLIEGFNRPGSVGLHLLGSVSSSQQAAAPHTWRCVFTNVSVAATWRPLVLDNADENDFYSCNFSAPPGLSLAERSLASVDIVQGRNNRFFGLLVNGDRDVRTRDAYVGLLLRRPTRGANSGHQVYGLVAEGFGCGIYIESADVQSIRAVGYNSSLNAHAFWNGTYDGEPASERQNDVRIEMAGGPQAYQTTRSASAEPVTIPDGAAEPSVAGSNTFACHNSRPTTVTDFRGGNPGQTIVVRLDARTTLAPGGGLRLADGQPIIGTDQTMVSFVRLGGAWQQMSLSRNAG